MPKKCRLLFCPYRAPALRRGDRVTCLARDSDVIITSWSDAHIPWPRCRTEGARGGYGLLVDEELARAVRHESATATKYWWGVGVHAVWNWRTALGIGRMDSEGSRRLLLAAVRAGAEKVKRDGLTDDQCDRRSEQSKALNLARFLRANPPRPLWKKADLRLLGKEPDAVIAARLGRTVEAVRVMRSKLGIRSPLDRRRAANRKPC